MLTKTIRSVWMLWRLIFTINKSHTQGQSLASVSANEIRESLHCHGNNDDDTKARRALWSIQVIQPITETRIHAHYTSALPSEICVHASVWDLARSLRPASLTADVIPVGEGAQVAVCICVCVCKCVSVHVWTAGLWSQPVKIHTSQPVSRPAALKNMKKQATYSIYIYTHRQVSLDIAHT